MLDTPRALEEIKMPENLQNLIPAFEFLQSNTKGSIKNMVDTFKMKLGVH